MSLIVRRRTSRLGGFSPPVLPGLLVSFDALAITGRVDGDPVPQWDDTSGNNRHATQPTGSKQPTYRTAVTPNGGPAVRFDGVDDLLLCAAVTIPAEFTVYSVSVSTASGVLHGVVTGDTRSVADMRAFQHRYGSTNAAESISFTSGGAAATDTEPVTRTNMNILVTTRAATSVRTHVNGTSNGATATTAGATRSPTLGLGISNISLLGDINGYLNGSIAAALVYDRAHSDTDRRAVEAYLGSRYGVAVV